MVGNKLSKQYILITSSNFPVGGAGANYLNLFCKGLKICNCNIRVLLLKGFSFGNHKTNHKKNNITEEGVPFSYLGLTVRPNNLLYKFLDDLFVSVNVFVQLFKLLPKRKKVTLLIYNNEVTSNVIIYLLAWLFSIKIVSFVPEFYDKNVFKGSFLRKIKWYGFLLNFSYLNKLSNKLIVFSHYLKEQYLMLGFKESNIIIQPILTDFDFWEIKNSSINYTLGYSGTPTKENGLHDLFKAMSLLQKEGINISLIIIGDNLFGNSYVPKLKIECEKFKISNIVFFTGLVEQEKVKRLISECKILILPRELTVQTQAGFPTRLGEYFASKKNVLVTNFGDIEKYFKSGIDLVIAKCGDSNDIAKKIKWIMQNNQQAEIITSTGYHKSKLLLEYKTNVKRIVGLIN